MLTHLTTFLAQHITLSQSGGIFFSCFDEKNKLINSHGVVVSDKPLEKVIEMLYHGLIEPIQKDIHHIICHIVTHTEEIHTLEDIQDIDINKYGIIIITTDYSKSGVLLPNTAGISTITEALNSLKKKHNITGNINIIKISFNTIIVPL